MTIEIDENGWLFPHRSPPGPTWLRNLIGIDYFATVGAVCLNTGRVNVTKATIDDAVGRLSDLPHSHSAALSGATDSMLLGTSAVRPSCVAFGSTEPSYLARAGNPSNIFRNWKN